MNKKFLSAILFGALMVSSTGTFVSCKDYDDDIKNLQGQIDTNKAAITELQKLVGQGKWVANISSIANGFTVTMSDGTSVNVTGINGENGKNGTEWTIGEDGFWYKDGEKTAFQAVAKDGEAGKPGVNGVTAPSPSIDANGMWVVYEWDATAGEFVAKTTEVSAQGTNAYVVAKDGVYELHIADEAGAYQTITLPATSDSFVAEAAYAQVNVEFETAAWTKWNASSNDAKALLKAFPGIADIKAKDIVKQGGNLPVIITPSTVELTDKYAYSLLTVKGETADIQVASPVKGLPASTKFDDGAMQTRAAEANSGLWTLKVEPAYYSAKKTYASVEHASLMVESEKGTVVRTAFAYNVTSKLIADDVTITASGVAKYASTIDVFEKPSTTDAAMFKLTNQYDGYFILEAVNAVQVEKYGLSVDGSKLTIANMPANETSIKVNLKLTALGLNGSTKSTTQEFTISQGVEATGELSAKSVVLSSDPTKATVRWNIAELGLTAVQLDNFLNNNGGNAAITVTREVPVEDKDGKVTVEKRIAYNSTIVFYNAAGNVTTYTSSTSSWTNGAAATFGFNVNAQNKASNATLGTDEYVGEQFTPADYTVSITSKNANTVIYSAETTLTVANPTAVAIKLDPNYVENTVAEFKGALRITGGKTITTTTGVEYTLTEGVIVDGNYIIGGVSSVTFVDLDNKEFTGAADSKDFANWNWIENSPKLIASKWINGDNVPANKQHMYKLRNIRATYKLFGNDDNEVNFDFKAYVLSEVYSADPSKAIVMNDMSAVYGVTKDGANTIDITKAVKSSKFVAGSDQGKSYTLFATKGGDVKVNAYQYGTIPSVASKDKALNFAVDANDMMIEIAVKDMKAFGFTSDAITKAQTGDQKYYLLATNSSDETSEYYGVKTLADLWGDATVSKYYSQVGATDYYTSKYNNAPTEPEDKAKIEDADAAINTLFSTYASKVNFAVTKNVKVATTAVTSANVKIAHVYLKVVAEGADKLIKNAANFDGKTDLNSTTGNTDAYRKIVAVDKLSEGVASEVSVAMQLIVVDAWNKTMVVPFNITLKTN